MATNNLLLHPLTETSIQAVLQRPPHALVLSGATGSGKTAVGRLLAAGLLGIPLEELQRYPYFSHIEPVDGKAIGIEAVRELEHLTALKIPSTGGVSRVVLISDGHLLTTEAQNALLKTLEEPPLDTVLILTSAAQEALLPTIRSRAQTVSVLPPARDALQLAVQTEAGDEAAQIMAVSGGLPGLAFALARGEQDHPLTAAAATARQLLQQSTFEKLAQVDGLSKNKELGRGVIYILMQMAHAALLTGRGTDRWQKVLQAAYDAESALQQGVQPKLALTELMLNL